MAQNHADLIEFRMLPDRIHHFRNIHKDSYFQKTEAGKQPAEIRGRKTDGKRQKPKTGCQMPAIIQP
jgi:hypothetical protein